VLVKRLASALANQNDISLVSTKKQIKVLLLVLTNLKEKSRNYSRRREE